MTFIGRATLTCPVEAVLHGLKFPVVRGSTKRHSLLSAVQYTSIAGRLGALAKIARPGSMYDMSQESRLSVSRKPQSVGAPSPEIERHKTAIRRKDFSLPVKCAMRDGLLGANASFFDFGCGHGEDVELLASEQVKSSGWDPAFRPDEPLAPSEVVNIGYVLNVIEDPVERADSLLRAWGICGNLLVVAARVNGDGRGYSKVKYGDGIVTGIGTFQKYYTQAELKEYLESQLNEEAIPAALGVFYVFKDATMQQDFLARRFRRRSAAPRTTVSEKRFEENRALLEPFMARIAELGRLPEADEYEGYREVFDVFGSAHRAFALIRRVTQIENWDEIRSRRTEDLLVYLALARFRRRPPVSKLPRRLQRDIREFLGSYKRACQRADDLLFTAGDPEAIDQACRDATVGKLLPNALYVHRSSLNRLDPLLRVYEGCARAYLGEIEDANIIKLHRSSGKVSYLAYPKFDRVAHPVLARSVKLSLRSLQLDIYDYTERPNPPILHRKDSFVMEDYPHYRKFLRLTQQEEQFGLLDKTSMIGTRNGWEILLQAHGLTIRGHRVVLQNPASDANDQQ